MADALVAEVSAIDLLTDVQGGVTTHVYTGPDIYASARTTTEPERDDLIRIGTAVQDAVDRHQLDGAKTGVALRTTARGADLTWHWTRTTPTTPEVEQQVDAGLAEIALGAPSVTVHEVLNSRWSTIPDPVVLHAAPPGMGRVTRWINPGLSQDLRATVHAGEPGRVWPVAALTREVRPMLNSLSLVMMDGWAHWQLSLAIDEETADAFADAMVNMLRLLRTVDGPRRHTVDCTGPWWVNFAIGPTVSIDAWPPDKVRTVDPAVIQQVVDRANG